MDSWQDRFRRQSAPLDNLFATPTKYEIEQVKDRLTKIEGLYDEILKMVQEIKAAQKFDDDTGQPNCHNEDKIAVIRKICAAFDIDLDKEVPNLK